MARYFLERFVFQMGRREKQTVEIRLLNFPQQWYFTSLSSKLQETFKHTRILDEL